MICSVCFGDPNSLMTIGYNYGIGTLLIVIAVVLLCFGLFFYTIYKRSRSRRPLC